jgi:hypothetical protein
MEELQAINKQMLKALPKGKKANQKLIGDGMTIKHLKSQIEIVRIPRVKVNTLLICTVCSNNFEKKLGKPLYVNYGGMKRTLYYCSETCRGVVAEVCGDTRASVKSKEVKNALLF